MADLTSANVTITVQNQRYFHGTVAQKRHQVKIEFGDGALTYPTGGVPMPAKDKFGMVHALEFLSLIDDNDATGIVWKYDKENNKLRGFIQGITVSAAGAATMDDFALDTTADPLATTVSVSLTNSTGAGAKYLGKMLELAGGSAAPAAQVLYAEAVGF